MQSSLKTGKRALTSAVAAATMLWSVGFSSLVAPLTARAAAPGDLVRGTTLSTLYYYGQDGKRYAFPNEKTYFTWYADFSGVQTISDSELAAIPLGGNVSYRPGSRWIKIESDPKTYAVSPNGVLRWIETEEVATGLAGSDWNQFIDDVADVFFVDYTVGPSLTSAANAYNGALVRDTDGSYYVIQNNTKRLVTSDGFTANRLQTRNALDGSGINLSAINTGANLASREAAYSNPAQLPEQVQGGLTVSLASDSPASTTIAARAQGVVLAKFNLSSTNGATTVNSLTIKQGGLGSTNNVESVYLYEGNTRLTSGRTVNSASREVTFGTLNLALASGQTRTISVVADIADSETVNSGDTLFFEIESANKVVSGSTVGGNFPVRGASVSLSATEVGTLTLSKGGTITNPTLGQKQAVIGEFHLASSSEESVRLQRLRLTVDAASNHDNFNLFQNDVLVAVGTRSGSDTVDFIFTNQFEIAQGNNRIFQLKADIGGKSGDEIKVSVDESSDIYAIGTKYGFGVAVVDGSPAYRATGSSCANTGSSCSFSQIQGGKLTFAFNGPTASRFNLDQNGLVLMDLTVTSENEATIRHLAFSVTGADLIGEGTNRNYQNFRLVDKATGATVSGPVEMSGNDTEASVAFPDDWAMRAGESIDLQLLVDAKGGNAPYTVSNGETIRATFVAGSTQARDINNRDLNLGTDIVPNANLTGHLMTAQAASLTVAASQPPSSSTYVRGAQNVDMLGVSFQTGTASAVRVTAAAFGFGTDTEEEASSHITSCSIHDAASGALVDGPRSFSGAKVNFNGFNWTIPAGTTGKLIARCNFANLPADGDQWWLTLAKADITALDADGNTLTSITDAEVVNGGEDPAIYQTLNESGQLTVALDGSSPQANIILGASTGVTTSVFRFSTNNEPYIVKSLTLETCEAGYGCNEAVANAIRLSYTDKSGAARTATSSFSGGKVHFGDLDLYVPTTTHALATVSIDTNTVSSTGAQSGNRISLSLIDEDFEALGESSGNTITTVTPVAGREQVLRKTKPTVSLASGSPAGFQIPGFNEVLLFNVTADSRGYVDLKEVTFRVTSSNNAEAGTWNECDVLGDAAKWQIYNKAEPSNILGDWDFYDVDGGECDGAAPLAYAKVTFADGAFGTEEIGAGQTKTYAVRLDTTGASAAMDDSIRLDIPAENQLPAGEVDLDGSLLWGDDNTGVDADGAYIRNLPVLGGTIGY